jgi:hypothetical protein
MVAQAFNRLLAAMRFELEGLIHWLAYTSERARRTSDDDRFVELPTWRL